MLDIIVVDARNTMARGSPRDGLSDSDFIIIHAFFGSVIKLEDVLLCCFFRDKSFWRKFCCVPPVFEIQSSIKQRRRAELLRKGNHAYRKRCSLVEEYGTTRQALRKVQCCVCSALFAVKAFFSLFFAWDMQCSLKTSPQDSLTAYRKMFLFSTLNLAGYWSSS